jgi:hypothetical protein
MPTTVRWRESFEDGVRESRETGRPILLDFFNPH